MRTAAALRPQRPELAIPKMTKLQWLQSLIYSTGLAQYAIGVSAAVYVLLTQATYFGWVHHFSDGTTEAENKWIWDNLNLDLHFKAIPWIGTWLFNEWDFARHLYGRHVPEVVLAYAFVAILIVKGTKLKDKVPIVDRIITKAGMPSRYQGKLGRHENTSLLQMIMLPVSMLVCALFGAVLFSVVIFGGMAIAHRLGYDPSWLQPEGTIDLGPIHIAWVPIVIGIGAGTFYGHKPAVKAGEDINHFFIEKRLNIAYAAEAVMNRAMQGAISVSAAVDAITDMRHARPSKLYPAVYRQLYDAMRAAALPVPEHGRLSTIANVGAVVVVGVLGLYGLYVLHWGVKHGFWMP